MEIFQQFKEDDEVKEEETETKLKSKSYICYLISKYWCKILAFVIISIVYCLVELLREIILQDDGKINNLLCKMYLDSNNSTAIDVCA